MPPRDYRAILGEALSSLNGHGSGEREIGTGKATVALGMVIGDISEKIGVVNVNILASVEKIQGALSTLKDQIKIYSDTAERQAKGAAWLSVALIFATVVLALFTFFQGWEVMGQRVDAQKVSSANLALQFDQKLNTGTALLLSTAIETPHTPILRANGGQFTGQQLEDVLGQYDTIGELYAEGLINDRISYDEFSYDVVLAYQNPEISAYLKSIRAAAKDQTLYDKFDYLAQVFMSQQKTGVSNQLDRP